MRKEFQFVSDEDLAAATNKGRVEGRVEGRAEGRAEGKEETIRETVKRLIQKNCSDDFITSVTDANETEINAIRAEMNNG